MPISIKDLRAQQGFQYYPPVFPIQSSPPQMPLNVKATGKEGYIIVQWRPTGSADSYQVAMMTDQNLAAPDLGLATIPGGQSSRYEYHVGNVVLTRYFAVRSLKDAAASPFSDIVSATSVITDAVTATGSAEPAAPFTEEAPSQGDTGTRYDDFDPSRDRG